MVLERVVDRAHQLLEVNQRQSTVHVGIEGVDEHVGVSFRNNLTIVSEELHEVHRVDLAVTMCVNPVESIDWAEILTKLCQRFLLELAVLLSLSFIMNNFGNLLKSFK